MQVFFYGLFMDVDILSKNGIYPTEIKQACLKDYILKIGERASLLPCLNEDTYGLVMTIEDGLIRKLYSEASVAIYRPENVEVRLINDERVQAVCYNLPAQKISGTNKTYASALLALAEHLKFPQSYLNSLRAMT